MGVSQALQAHLDTGTTTLCRAWSVSRTDGVAMGFTDHDLDLSIDGLTYRADSGLSASAIQQGNGLAVDNSEAIGVLSHAGLQDEDILAGRYDGAEVLCWLVNWSDVAQRSLLFRGKIGEIKRSGGAFQAELRGATEGLNQPTGRIFQSPCSAVLGDAVCGVNLAGLGYFTERPVEEISDRKIFRFADMTAFDDRWFEGGRLRVLSGAGVDLVGLVKNDRLTNSGRTIELWQDLAAEVKPGDVVRIEAGCDKRARTCQLKFNNIVNFQGFPHIPGEDWLMRYPNDGVPMTGGSLFA